MKMKIFGKHACQGNVKLLELKHVILNCYQLNFRKSRQVW